MGPAFRLGRPFVGRVAGSLCAVVALAFAGTARGGDSTTTPTPPPCVAAGVVAVVEPGASAAQSVGPSVAAAAQTGTSAASFQDPGNALDVGKVAVGAAGCVEGSAPGGTSTRAGKWSVLGGAVAGTALRADLVPAGGDGSGWHLRAHVTGLTVGGAPAAPIPGASIEVGNWGVLEVSGRLDGHGLLPFRFWAAALELKLTSAHAGLPAGTIVLIGYASANQPPAAPPPVVTRPAGSTITATVPSRPVSKPKARPKPVSPAPAAPTPARAPARHATTKTSSPRRVVRPRTAPAQRVSARPRPARPAIGEPLRATPPLGSSAYVFPTATRAVWGDTYGAARSDVPGGWHHGDDLFAPLGTPVVAVADGTVYSVGWNRVGGWRLWLMDAWGNEFYYAHLSGYTALARNGRSVHRGQALGFVGNTGDAFTTWPHLHFEVHPNSLLFLGYDGAVDPTSYLRSWPQARHVVVLPPVALPGAAPPGQGSATDFRRLLVVHPLRPARRTSPAMTAASTEPEALPRTRSVAGPIVASGPTTRAASGGDGAAALVAGILMLLAAGAVLAYTARSGRSS